MDEVKLFKIKKYIIMAVTGFFSVVTAFSLLLFLFINAMLYEYVSGQKYEDAEATFYFTLIMVMMFLVLLSLLATNVIGFYGVLKESHRFVRIYTISSVVWFVLGLLAQLSNFSFHFFKLLLSIAYLACVITFERDIQQLQPAY